MQGFDWKGWIVVWLAIIGVLARVFIWIDDWVHRRSAGETKLSQDLLALKAQIDDGRSIWDKSVELGHQVAAVQNATAEAKRLFERTLERSDGESRTHSDRLRKMELQMERIDEHLRNTDKGLDDVRRILRVRSGDRE